MIKKIAEYLPMVLLLVFTGYWAIAYSDLFMSFLAGATLMLLVLNVLTDYAMRVYSNDL